MSAMIISSQPLYLTNKALLEESLLLTKVYLVVRQNVSWLFQSSVTKKVFLQGVPKKRVILGKMPITGLGRGLKIKVGGVLKNSGNFQSNEHRNFVFLSKND